MTIKARMIDHSQAQEIETEKSDQITFVMEWESRKKWYTVSTVTITHNRQYPTPAINITAPNPGIRFTVTDLDRNVLYTNVKEKE